MSITSNGVYCDVCGEPVLGLVADDTFDTFQLSIFPDKTLVTHNKDCKEIMQSCTSLDDIINNLDDKSPIKKAVVKAGYKPQEATK